MYIQTLVPAKTKQELPIELSELKLKPKPLVFCVLGPLREPIAQCHVSPVTSFATLNADGNISTKIFRRMQSSHSSWTCHLCLLKEMPFADLDNICSVSDAGSTGDTDSDFASADIVDSMSWYQSNINSYYKFNLKIAYLNINSLINKVDEVKEMLSRNMFDILFIAETKIDCSVSSSLLSQPGYRTVRKDRKKGGGGLMAYIRAELSVYRRAKLEADDIESICLDVKDNNISRFLVCACYRSPGKCKELDFLAALSSAAETMYKTRKELLLLGDFNMDLYHNSAEDRLPNSHLVDFCQRFCLVNKISEPTRVTDKTKTLIDVVLSSHQERYATSGTLHLGVSDHDLIFIVRKNKVARPKPRFTEYRSMKKI